MFNRNTDALDALKRQVARLHERIEELENCIDAVTETIHRLLLPDFIRLPITRNPDDQLTLNQLPY